jgi:hypothetical protein
MQGQAGRSAARIDFKDDLGVDCLLGEAVIALGEDRRLALAVACAKS